MKKIIPSLPAFPSDVVEAAWLGSYSSDKTKLTYAKETRYFKEFLERISGQGGIGLLDVQGIHATAYFHELGKELPEGKALSGATLQKKIAVLRSFYGYAIGCGYYDSVNPFSKRFVKSPSGTPKQTRPTKYLKANQVKKLFASEDARTLRGKRNLCLYACLFYGGLRISEALDLRLDSLKQTPSGTHYLALYATKGGSGGTVSISPTAARHIKAWLTWRKKMGAVSSDKLIVSIDRHGNMGASLSRDQAAKELRRTCHRAKLPSISTHSGRASAITQMLNAGLSHREVLRFSRHSSVIMVERYDKERATIDSGPGRELEY